MTSMTTEAIKFAEDCRRCIHALQRALLMPLPASYLQRVRADLEIWAEALAIVEA